MRLRIYPYKQGSKSAAALAEALTTRVLKLEASRFRERLNDVIINWGHNRPRTFNCRVLNENVSVATNKLAFFQRMAENEETSQLVPQFWTNRNEIPADAYPVVCRTVLNGHSGRGIVVADGPDDLVDAPLYVKYIKKQSEYRIHVGRNQDQYVVISEQRKVRRPDTEVADWRIRNHGNGFIFQRQNLQIPNAVRECATKCLEAVGLDFGAVDVIWNDRQQRAYALEVNTACGLEGQTIEDYANYFRSIV